MIIKSIIGKWNNKYTVFMNKDKKKDKVFWTVESDGKVHNTFESSESFGHWIFHSGFIPKMAK